MLTLSVSTLTHDKAQPVMASVARDAIGQGLMACDYPSIALDEFD
jgi:hypothetical protein